MDKSKVLSTEEVDALLNVAQDKEHDLSKLISRSNHPDENQGALNNKAVANITELTWSECEKIYSTFVRKKIIVRSKSSNYGKLLDCLENKEEKHVYCVFHLMPKSCFALVIISFPLLTHMINALYGGIVSDKEPIMEAPGKVGVIVAEKLSELAMESFILACKEYGEINADVIKTVVLPNLISKLSMDDEVYSMEYTVGFGDVESDLTVMIPLDFLQSFVPANPVEDEEHKQQHKSWRTSIEHQVIDSEVTVIASLPEINIKASDLVSLKEGDLIPIGDPTTVDIYLNNVKLFKGSAAQENSNRIVKILGDN